MMKRILSLLVASILVLGCAAALADDGGYTTNYNNSYNTAYTPINGTNLPANMSTPSHSTLLSGLTHNCPNTGIMLPKTFSPYETTYLLTVASWVSRPTFTPVAMDPTSTITVNGKVVKSGTASQAVAMTDEPQAVTIRVTNVNGASTTYTIYLQRRPSEKRTKISAGYINKIYQKGSEMRIDADLGTVKYLGTSYQEGNRSSFTNKSADGYDYVVDPNCILYYGTKHNPIRAADINEFMINYRNTGSNLYTIIYLEDEIVCVLPYGADY